MINLRNSPFFWLSLLLLIAYGLGSDKDLIAVPFMETILLGAFLFCCCIGIITYKPGSQFLSTLAIAGLIITAGILRINHFTDTLFKGEALSGSVKMEGIITVTEVLKVRAYGITLKGQAHDLQPMDEHSPQKYHDLFILVQVRDSSASPMLPGDILYVHGWVSPLSAPLNPHAFDMRKYYRMHGIRHQLYCKAEDTQIQSPEKASIIRKTAQWQKGLSALVRSHTESEVAQLTNALVWGDRSDMDPAVRDAFADSGAMHVLSVSGMHVAIIYSMLYLVLGAPGSGSHARRMTRLGIYTFAILLYMGLTGASPAVIRAGLMIILYLTGKAMGWNTQTWNLLGFAAFLMLWINPFIWRHVGFQLSFLAMAGLMMYAKPIMRSLSFKSTFLQRTWDITSVSIAAQVFIVPVLLNQFHQFPITFILSSLVAMPASYVVIFGALFNVALSSIGIDWLWPLLDVSGQVFLQTMKWMASLNPTMHFSLPALSGILLMGVSVFFSATLIYQWSLGRKAAYICGAFALVTMGCHRTAQWRTNDIVIYHQVKGLLIDIIVDGKCVSVQDSSLTESSMEFTTRGYRCYRDIIQTINVLKGGAFRNPACSYHSNVIEFPGTSLLIWSGDEISLNPETTITHLLIDDCPEPEAALSFIQETSPGLVILPAHLGRYAKNNLVKKLETHEINFYDIGQQGYLKLPL